MVQALAAQGPGGTLARSVPSKPEQRVNWLNRPKPRDIAVFEQAIVAAGMSGFAHHGKRTAVCGGQSDKANFFRLPDTASYHRRTDGGMDAAYRGFFEVQIERANHPPRKPLSRGAAGELRKGRCQT